MAELDRIGGEIRARIGESRRSIRRDPPLEQVTTASLEALRLYTDSARLMFWEGRNLDAIPLLERVLEEDSTFAAAYALLSRAVQDVPDWGRRDELNRKAYQHRDRLTAYERLRIDVAYRFVETQTDTTRPPDECDLYRPLVDMYEAYARQHPDDPRPLNAFGFNLERTGRSDEAMEVYGRAIERGHATPGVLNNQVVNLAIRRRFQEARGLLELWRERFGESYRLLLAEMVVAGRGNDYPAPDSLYTAYQERYGPEPDMYVAQGRVDALRGRMAEAWLHYAAGIDELERRGHPIGLAGPLVSRGMIRLVALGDTAGALAPVTEWLARLPSDTTLAGEWVDVGILRAMAGDVDGARVALDTLVASNRGNWSIVRGPLTAAIALAEGRPAAALEALESSRIPCSFIYGQFRTDPRLRRVLAGRAHEALDQQAGAIAEYEAYLGALPWAYPIGLDAIFLFDTLERLARLHDDLGHDDEAAAYYARAADLWADADPELQPRVRTLRERAAALVGEGRA